MAKNILVVDDGCGCLVFNSLLKTILLAKKSYDLSERRIIK